MVVAVVLAAAVVVVLAIVLIVTLRRRAQVTVTEATGTEPVGGSLEDQLRALLRRRQKIQAIKLLREHTRLGLNRQHPE